MKTVKVLVSGRVQGVGFRYFVKCHARELQLNGYARNLPDGRVEVVAQGSSSSIQALLELLKKGPDYASVTSLEPTDLVDTIEYKDFLTG